MKIESNESVNNLKSLHQSQKEQETARKTGVEQPAEGDQVQLSPRAQEFQRIKEVLEMSPEVREEKVAEIAKQIDEGTYVSDSSKAAENLVTESLIDVLV
ncbi:MAG: flagellar biosynthesis anti-sigma factor FlgM [Deltaproteobacteria bacterium]|nr:flagellar biosynthesis anti-sigma factor FlgM [Deltaproteobacteria bacterium]